MRGSREVSLQILSWLDCWFPMQTKNCSEKSRRRAGRAYRTKNRSEESRRCSCHAFVCPALSSFSPVQWASNDSLRWCTSEVVHSKGRATFQVGSICWRPDQKIAYVEILYKCVGLPREVFLQILSYYPYEAGTLWCRSCGTEDAPGRPQDWDDCEDVREELSIAALNAGLCTIDDEVAWLIPLAVIGVSSPSTTMSSFWPSAIKTWTKAVIFLARRQIRKYAKEEVGTGFLRWCLLRTCELHRVFVTTQTAGVQIHNVCRGHLGRNVIFSVGIQYYRKQEIFGG